MENIRLEYGETIIGDYGLFWDDKIKSISESGHVYITTKRLVLSYAKLHVFRADEEYSYSYPLSSIDHIEVTQLPKNSRDNTWYKCKAYLSNGVIHFSDPRYEDFAPFVNMLNAEITGDPNPLVGSKQTLVSDVANALSSVTNQFTTAFSKKIVPQQVVAEKVSISCPGCGATLTGWHGKTVICEYCTASRQL
ncbi:hypothetical protein LDX61_06300 [Bifidobacterium pseudolongum]|uniref:hypothetical protein n=1 Tax=Bifidobacterium pseudolongum TaxID=1694 RepID=UPI001CE1E9DD|nr:hypothetical protein [Bifidobacterium pseudolongum]UBY93917.1 hypothetical protein LDX61_06300 [Bifidobacterium pseudolongum]UBZ02751.1 hypothetical protein LDH93_06305 [Bifidobacterium pseudolongum]UBZ04322.1 hypothetical protein LDX67_06300 [Bifidobacterium pseudolongum]